MNSNSAGNGTVNFSGTNTMNSQIGTSTRVGTIQGIERWRLTANNNMTATNVICGGSSGSLSVNSGVTLTATSWLYHSINLL